MIATENVSKSPIPFGSWKSHIQSRLVINAGGLHADKIATAFGVEQKYRTLFIKGNYLKAKLDMLDPDFPKTLFYPVPPSNTKDAMLGVHTTWGGTWVKIGPSGFPGFWREDYGRFQNFSVKEFFKTY